MTKLPTHAENVLIFTFKNANFQQPLKKSRTYRAKAVLQLNI